jgi:hypothetical protein
MSPVEGVMQSRKLNLSYNFDYGDKRDKANKGFLLV